MLEIHHGTVGDARGHVGGKIRKALFLAILNEKKTHKQSQFFNYCIGHCIFKLLRVQAFYQALIPIK